MWHDALRAQAIAIVAIGGAASGCRNDWRTDMWYQPSIGPEEQPRPEPARSIPLAAGVHWADREEAEGVPNPVARSPASIQHGGWLFAERCACCHGTKGHGEGPVSRLFPPAPDLAYPAVRARSDGYIFATIVLGGRAMPAVGTGLMDRDRWDLVNYVRTIQDQRPGRGAP